MAQNALYTESDEFQKSLHYFSKNKEIELPSHKSSSITMLHHHGAGLSKGFKRSPQGLTSPISQSKGQSLYVAKFSDENKVSKLGASKSYLKIGSSAAKSLNKCKGNGMENLKESHSKRLS